MASLTLICAAILSACAANVPTGTWRLDAAASQGGCPIPEMTLYRDSISVMGFSSRATYRTAHGSTEVIQPDLGLTLLRYRTEGRHLVVDLAGIPGMAQMLAGGATQCRYRRP